MTTNEHVSVSGRGATTSLHRAVTGGAALVVLLLAGGCGADHPSARSASVLPSPSTPAAVASAAVPSPQPPSAVVESLDTSWITDPALTCDADALAFPPSALGAPTGAELLPDPSSAALRAFMAGPDAPASWDPGQGWRRVLQTPRTAVFLGESIVTGERLFVAFSHGPKGWTFEIAGVCQLRVVLPAGLGPVTWELDPAHAVAATSTAVHVLAHERACSGGTDPTNRLVAPVVIETADGLVMALAARILPGARDCSGNPTVGIRIDLGKPIGNRSMFDGSAFPPEERY